MASLTMRSRAFAAAQARQQELSRAGLWRSPQGAKRPLTERLRDGAWAGRRAFLIGGGPSLIGFDFERLRGEHVIAVNKSFLSTPWAEIMFAMDNNLYRWIMTGALGLDIKEAFERFAGLRVWLDLGNYAFGPGVHYVRGLKAPFWPTTIEHGLFSGTNSGYGALMLAACLRASPIYLLGYDLSHAGKITHHHGGYPGRQTQNQLDRFSKHFAELAPHLVASGVDVVNLNPQSRLRSFRFQRPEEVLGAQNGIPGAAGAAAGAQEETNRGGAPSARAGVSPEPLSEVRRADAI